MMRGDARQPMVIVWGAAIAMVVLAAATDAIL
jgi:hypothetical protein